MAIIFQKKEKKEKKLILIFIVLILIMAIIVWWGFFRKIEIPYEEPLVPPRKEIRVNFEVLRDPILGRFEPFTKIEPFEQEIGRKNPFVLFREKVEEEIIPEDVILE